MLSFFIIFGRFLIRKIFPTPSRTYCWEVATKNMSASQEQNVQRIYGGLSKANKCGLGVLYQDLL